EVPVDRFRSLTRPAVRALDTARACAATCPDVYWLDDDGLNADVDHTVDVAEGQEAAAQDGRVRARSRASRSTTGRRLLALVLVSPDQYGPRERVEEQVEAQEGGRGALGQAQRLDVDGVHDEEVAVRTVPGGRG